MKELKLIVYKMVSNAIQAIGMLQEYVSLSYSPRFNEVGSFTLVIPFSLDSFDLVSRKDDCEKLVLLEDGIIGICHKVYVSNTPTKKQIKIQGMLAEGILENNASPNFYVAPSSTSEYKNIQTRMSSFITNHETPGLTGTWWPGVRFKTITPSDERFVLSDGYQITAGTTRNMVESLAKAADLGYSVRLASEEATDFLELQFQTYANRTVNQSESDPVMVSTRLSDLYSSEFNLNSQNWKNVVYAYGTFETTSGSHIPTSQIVIYDEYESIQDIPVQQIRAIFSEVDLSLEGAMSFEEAATILQREGKLILYDFALVKSYNCKLRESEGTFKFNRDYFLGDKLTVFDEELQLQIDAQLLEYTKTFDKNGESFEPIFGFSQPTLNRILKQKGVI